VLRQRWERLLFAHWEVDPSLVRPLLPRPLELDLRDGRAWLTVTPHRISRIRLGPLPAVPGASSMLEVSLRTYVAGERPGVYFLALDTDSRLGRWAARRWFGISYELRPLELSEREGTFDFRSPRFTARYRAAGEPFTATPGDVDHFLAERSCLYAPDGRRIDVELGPWLLRPAEAELVVNRIVPTATEPGRPTLLRLCERQDVRLSRPT
jgi:uncharacterized protein